MAMASPRRFNTTGPNDPRRNYTLPVLRRIGNMHDIVARELYFVIHAPRQVGKTTTMLAFAQELTEKHRYAAVVVSVEAGVAFRDDIGAAELAILNAWRFAAEVTLPTELQPPPCSQVPPGGRIGAALGGWAKACPRPLVVFIDEIDALEGDTLMSVLRQIRDGHKYRPKHFPHSLALIGMRNVRDGKLASGGADRSHSSSPFNIAAEALTLRNFTHDEVAELYAQHTAETGQTFLPEAIPIYREIIPKVLLTIANQSIPTIQPIWLKSDGRMDFDALLQAFLAFWQRHGEPLLQSTPYHEAAPHLVLLAFLDRVSNGGGKVHREFAIGMGRMDLLLERGPDRLPIEVKVWRNEGDRDPLNDGLEQFDGYLGGLGLPTGWLIIFDRRPNVPPIYERLQASKATTPSGKDSVLIRA